MGGDYIWYFLEVSGRLPAPSALLGDRKGGPSPPPTPNSVSSSSSIPGSFACQTSHRHHFLTVLREKLPSVWHPVLQQYL